MDREPETQLVGLAAADSTDGGAQSEYPATGFADKDLEKEKMAEEKGGAKKPRPASSEGMKATG